MHTINIDRLGSSQDKTQCIQPLLDDKNIEVEFSYTSDFSNAKILRDFMETILSNFNLDPKDVARFILASDEMNNNAIEHGSFSGDKNFMRVSIKTLKDNVSINIEVQDSGKGKNSKKAEEMENEKLARVKKGFAHHASIRGRGLFLIIINIVDELYFKDAQQGGLIVGFKKDLPI